MDSSPLRWSGRRSMPRPDSPGGATCNSNPYAVRRGSHNPGRSIGIFPMHRQPPREPPGDDSSIWPEELPYAVGQLERLGPR